MKRTATTTTFLLAQSGLPTDVLLIIFRRIYVPEERSTLYAHEMLALLDMRCLSTWFKCGIDAMLHSLTELSIALTRKLTHNQFSLFSGLHALRLDRHPDTPDLRCLNQLSCLTSLSLGPRQHVSPPHWFHCHGLTNLCRLRTLELGIGELHSSLALSRLTGLTSLSLQHRRCDDTRFLCELTGLRSLAMGSVCTRAYDRQLLQLPSLTLLDLELDEGGVSDATLAQMSQLRVLRLGHRCQITDASLSRLTQLEGLALAKTGSPGSRIGPGALACLTNLRRLYLRNKANDVEVRHDLWLPMMTRLQRLAVSLHNVSYALYQRCALLGATFVHQPECDDISLILPDDDGDDDAATAL